MHTIHVSAQILMLNSFPPQRVHNKSIAVQSNEYLSTEPLHTWESLKLTSEAWPTFHCLSNAWLLQWWNPGGPNCFTESWAMSAIPLLSENIIQFQYHSFQEKYFRIRDLLLRNTVDYVGVTWCIERNWIFFRGNDPATTIISRKCIVHSHLHIEWDMKFKLFHAIEGFW